MNRPIRLLIVDDHEIVREGLITVLTGAPEVEVAGEVGTGAAAVELAAVLRPDVVLMDLVLPDIDGIEATRRIVSAGHGVQVLVLTSFGDDRRVQEAIQAGAIGYLLKDVRRNELLRAIADAAAGRPVLHPEAQRHLMRQAVALAEPSPLAALTQREREVLSCLARGQNNRDIAAALGLTQGTVKVYVSTILDKLGVADRTQAALLAARLGLQGD